MIFTFILALITLFFPVRSVWGAIDFSDAVFPELITSGRALALGNAYIAKVDDSAAAFYNPAGLGTVRNTHFHLSNLHLEANKDWIDLGTGGRLSDAVGNFTKGFDVDGTRQLLVNNPGNFSHSRFQFAPNFTTRYFSVGYLYSNQTRGAYGTQTDAQFEYAKRTDHGPFVALNLSLFGGVFKLGVTSTYLSRTEVFGQSAIDQTIDLQDADYDKGRGLILTGGMRLTLPVSGLPTLAIKMNNAAGQEFSAADGFAGAPETIRSSVDVGFSLTPQIGKTTRIHLEVNYKDATDRYTDVSTTRKIGAGMELDLMRTFFIRVGYGDGFGSGGLGIRTRKLEFDLTTYAVDRTNSQFRGEEDRRFALSISSGW